MIALGIATIGILGTWFGNGYLTRKFEKRKKKYEVKLERYTVLSETLDLLLLAEDFLEKRARAIEAFHGLLPEDLEDNEKFDQIWTPMADARGLMRMLKRSIGIEVSEDYSDPSEDQGIWERPENDTGAMELAVKRADYISKFWKYCQELNQCLEILVTRMERGISDIRVIGSMTLAAKIDRLYNEVLHRMLPSEDGIMCSTIQEARAWKSRVDELVVDLAIDLEKTL